jgi:hypothetical protein
MNPKLRMTRSQLCEHLRAHGYPIGDSTMDKLCAPAVNTGPPIDAMWGKRPLYDPDQGLAWAEARTRAPPDPLCGAIGWLRGKEKTNAL